VARYVYPSFKHPNRRTNTITDLPDVLDLPYPGQTMYTRTSLFIQTHSSTGPLSASLHICRPADFFSGNVHNLNPSTLYVRREHQSFRLLPKSGAIIMTTRTELSRLLEVESQADKAKLMDEVMSWKEYEASFKGRELWITALKGWCENRYPFNDDRTVSSATGDN
jgi:hypothetical protein